MSRGLGKTQRAILEYLAQPERLNTKTGAPEWSTIAELAAHVYDVTVPTPARLVATRRAVRALAADGRVETRRTALELELGRRTPARVSARWCMDDECDLCEDGIPRYTGRWADEAPSTQYPNWYPPPTEWVDTTVDRGWAWHCGEMAPRRLYDAVPAVIVRRPLTDKELVAELADSARRNALLRAALKGLT